MSPFPKQYAQASEQTRRRRANHNLTEAQIKLAKAMRDEDPPRDFSDIAGAIGAEEEAVKLALAPTRSPHGKRGHINVTLNGHEWFKRYARAGEKAWQTFDRLVEEMGRLQPA